jgi:hypothetical protein
MAATPDALMFAAHAVATLATALLLARGERAFGVLASSLRPLLVAARTGRRRYGSRPGTVHSP